MISSNPPREKRYAELLREAIPAGSGADERALISAAAVAARNLELEIGARLDRADFDALLRSDSVKKLLGAEAAPVLDRIAGSHLSSVISALEPLTGSAERAISRVKAGLPGLADHFDRALEAPRLAWDPGFLRKSEELQGLSPLSGSPFGTQRAALEAVATRRALADDHVFLITRTSGGFAVFEYEEDRLGRVGLSGLDPRGLPLGGDLERPQTWIVDARGRLGGLRLDRAGYRLERLEIHGSGQLVQENSGGRELWIKPNAPLFRLKEPPPIVEVLPLVVPERQVNHGQNVAWRPIQAFRPGADIDELARALRHVHRDLPGTKIKAGGSRHSWSGICATDGVYIHPEGMRFIESVAHRGQPGDTLSAKLDDAERDNLVRVGSGTTVRELNQALWARGKALPALGGFDGQTLGGVLPTGTHGSVLKHGQLCQMVRSVDLVRADGTKMRIEPKDGPTDPIRFKKEHPNMELVKEDQTFSASLIHLGAMGVVHSYLLEARDKFYLNEVRSASSFDEVLKTLKGGNIYHQMEVDQVPAWVGKDDGRRFEGHPKSAYHLEILFNPHSDKAVITSRHPTELLEEPPNFGQRPGRNLFRALDLGDRFTRPVLPTWVTEQVPKAIGWATEKLTRMIPKLTPWIVDRALESLPDKTYTQRSYNVFHIGDGANAIPSLSGTLFVPLSGDRYLEAMQVIKDTAAKFAKERGVYETAPISLRFVKGGDALLGLKEDSASFEIIFAGGTEHAQEMMRAYGQALHGALGKDVSFHWGQLSNGLSANGVSESHRDYAAWREVRDRLDPEGRFLNPWQEQILP